MILTVSLPGFHPAGHTARYKTPSWAAAFEATPAYVGAQIPTLHLHPIPHLSPVPSPCLSVYWKAWTSRRVSSTDLPTGRSFMVICLRTPLSSMMKSPLRHSKTRFNISSTHVTVSHSAHQKMISVNFVENHTSVCVLGPPDTLHSLLKSDESGLTAEGFSLVQVRPVFWAYWSWSGGNLDVIFMTGSWFGVA